MATKVTVYRTQKPNTLGGEMAITVNSETNGEEVNFTQKSYAMTSGAGEFLIPSDIKDEHTIILVAGSGTIKFGGGTGYAKEEITLTVSGTNFLTIDSARVTDRKTGMIPVTTTGTATFAVLSPRV